MLHTHPFLVVCCVLTWTVCAFISCCCIDGTAALTCLPHSKCTLTNTPPMWLTRIKYRRMEKEHKALYHINRLCYEINREGGLKWLYITYLTVLQLHLYYLRFFSRLLQFSVLLELLPAKNHIGGVLVSVHFECGRLWF
jgi:hypothetical protein